MDHVYFPAAGYADPAEQVLEEALAYIRFRSTDVVFLHLSEPDVLGHGFRWMSPPYMLAVWRADRAVRAFLEALPGDPIVIVTADHGGSGHFHRTATEANMRIPWIAHGGGIEMGEIERTVRTIDTAATLLDLFGVERPADWEGRPVELGVRRRCGG